MAAAARVPCAQVWGPSGETPEVGAASVVGALRKVREGAGRLPAPQCDVGVAVTITGLLVTELCLARGLHLAVSLLAAQVSAPVSACVWLN